MDSKAIIALEDAFLFFEYSRSNLAELSRKLLIVASLVLTAMAARPFCEQFT